MRRWTLARRAVAMVLLGALGMLAAIAALLVVTHREQGTVDELIGRINPARRDAAELLTTLLAEQDAVRGYASTGDPARKAAFEVALRERDEQVTNLRELLGDEPALASQLDALVAAAADWRSRGAEPLGTVAASGPKPTQDAGYQTEEQLFAPVLDSARTLLGKLDARRAEAIDQLAGYRRVELIALCCGAALAVAAAGATLLLLRRWVIKPINQIAEDARQVADGAHQHRVRIPPGPPDLAAVAADVERMRSRIAGELVKLEVSQLELRQTQERLRNQALDLMRSNRDLEQFAYVASHDLQEPLRKVSGFCQLLRRRYAGQLDERAEQYIDFAVDGAQRMQRLINDLLLFSRVGRSERPLTEVSLAEVTKQAIDEISSTDLEHSADGGSDGADTDSDQDVVAAAQFEVGELPTVHGDASLLRQLMTNLLGNAVKFHRPGVPPKVRVEAVRTGLGWEVSVADNGIGIDPEFAEKVFVIFQRLHGQGSYPGTGIGLALAKRIVEYHGGRIWLDPERQDGATVRFSLPFQTPPATQEPVHA